MKNLNISTRLTLGFGFVISLLIVVASLGTFGMSRINAALSNITDVNNVEAQLANQMKSTLQQRAIAIRNVVLLNEGTEMTGQVERIRKQEQLYAQAYAQLGQLFATTDTTPEEHALFDALKADEAAAAPLVEKSIKLGLANDDVAAAKVLMEELRPRQEQWLKRLTDLAAFEEQLNVQLAEQSKRTYHTLSVTVLTAAALATVLGLLAAWLIVRGVLRQLGGEPREAQYTARKIAQGDLTVRMRVAEGDKDSLMASLEIMRGQLSQVVSGIKLSAESISVAAAEIARGNTDLSQRTEEQAASLEETASSMEQLTSTVQQNTVNAKEGNTLAESARQTAQDGGAVVERVVLTMDEIAGSSAQMEDIISVVEGLAFQTNILALNAAVEAARAGEQGRGFAVVATEVRSLAQRSAAAAKEIRTLISNSLTHVQNGSQLVHQAGETMQAVLRSVQSVADVMTEITAASHEQSDGIEQINTAVVQMDQVTQQNAALVEQAAAAAQALSDQAQRLRSAVAVFTVDLVDVVNMPFNSLPQRSSALLT
jgi:methyl-accepting chemotaxis protein